MTPKKAEKMTGFTIVIAVIGLIISLAISLVYQEGFWPTVGVGVSYLFCASLVVVLVAGVIEKNMEGTRNQNDNAKEKY